MSRRPEASAVPPPAEKRLDAVLRAGVEHKETEEKRALQKKGLDTRAARKKVQDGRVLRNRGVDTGVAALSQLQRHVRPPQRGELPHHAQLPGQGPLRPRVPSDYKSDSNYKAEETKDGRSYNVESEDTRPGSATALRSMWNPSASVSGETFFVGTPGYETPTYWVQKNNAGDAKEVSRLLEAPGFFAPSMDRQVKEELSKNGSEYIKYDLGSIEYQTIDSFELKASTVKKLGDGFVPFLEEDRLASYVDDLEDKVGHAMLQMMHICEQLSAARPIMDDIVIGKADPTAHLTLSASGVTFYIDAQAGTWVWGSPSIVFTDGQGNVVEYWRNKQGDSFEKAPVLQGEEASVFAASKPGRIKYEEYETLKARKEEREFVMRSLGAIVMLIIAAFGTRRLGRNDAQPEPPEVPDEKGWEPMSAIDSKRALVRKALNEWVETAREEKEHLQYGWRHQQGSQAWKPPYNTEEEEKGLIPRGARQQHPFRLDFTSRAKMVRIRQAKFLRLRAELNELLYNSPTESLYLSIRAARTFYNASIGRGDPVRYETVLRDDNTFERVEEFST